MHTSGNSTASQTCSGWTRRGEAAPGLWLIAGLLALTSACAGSGDTDSPDVDPDENQSLESEAFCEQIELANEAAMNGAGLYFERDTDRVKALVEDLVESMEAVVPVAPDEIAEDVAILLDARRDFRAIVEIAGYEGRAVDNSLLDADRSAASLAALDRLNAFVADTCGELPSS